MNIALLFAGGTGTRMGDAEKPKQFMEVEGKAIIIHSILNFERHKDIDGIVVVCIEEWQDYLRDLLDKEGIKKVLWIVAGGPTGQQSIYQGVKVVYDHVEDPADTIILVSDGVRPFVSQDIITKNLDCVRQNGTSATSAFVTETIIQIDAHNEVIHIPDRKQCMLSKAPQGFRLDALMQVHQQAIAENKFDCTNSIELMRHYGHRIFVVEDGAENLKITTPFDMKIYQTLLEEQ